MNQMAECELRNDGIHVTVYKYGDKIAANLIMIRIMLGDEIFAMDGGEKVFADEGELSTFAKEAILPRLTRVVERLTKVCRQCQYICVFVTWILEENHQNVSRDAYANAERT